MTHKFTPAILAAQRRAQRMGVSNANAQTTDAATSQKHKRSVKIVERIAGALSAKDRAFMSDLFTKGVDDTALVDALRRLAIKDEESQSTP